jgi:hypothetical protein
MMRAATAHQRESNGVGLEDGQVYVCLRQRRRSSIDMVDLASPGAQATRRSKFCYPHGPIKAPGGELRWILPGVNAPPDSRQNIYSVTQYFSSQDSTQWHNSKAQLIMNSHSTENNFNLLTPNILAMTSSENEKQNCLCCASILQKRPESTVNWWRHTITIVP